MSILLDASELLEDAERPERIWAKVVAGTDRLKDRRAAFAEFKAHTGEDGEECGILCNSWLLSEGIDVAAVDAICFADPKSSVIDIVQAVGRALRRSYRQGKVSWVIIPVYLPTSEVGDDTATAYPAEVHDAGEAVKAEADAEIEASSFRTIWRVLRALAAHDARVVGRITELRASRSQGTAHTTTAKPAEAAEGEQQPAPVESPIEWLRINAKQHAARILLTDKLRAFNPRAVEWQRVHAVAAVFHLQRATSRSRPPRSWTPWTSCGGWSRTGTAPTDACSPTSPPAQPWTARRSGSGIPARRLAAQAGQGPH
ncbi:helicase-related protein [Kitasatospora sp. NPDC050463]|uniref:helicase-related protein n=1 Tax=Kitasatospora sp. NPDC050463 TaxID=3155786 RepID=UPI0033F34005